MATGDSALIRWRTLCYAPTPYYEQKFCTTRLYTPLPLKKNTVYYLYSPMNPNKGGQRKLFVFLYVMKKLLIAALLLAPGIAFAAISVPWNRTQVGTITPLYPVDGILVNASSTIGNGTVGLTNYGPATTTGTFYQGGVYSHFGSVACKSSLIGIGDSLELCGDSNSDSAGTQLQISNNNPGTAAFTGVTLNNDAAIPSLGNGNPYFAGFYLNSCGYTSGGFGTAFAHPCQTILQNTLGALSIVISTTSLTNNYVNFLKGVNDTDEIMRIDGPTGNVGIGTSTPRARLSVVGNPSVTQPPVFIGSGVYATSTLGGNNNGTSLAIYNSKAGTDPSCGDLIDAQQYQSPTFPGQSYLEVNGCLGNPFAVTMVANVGIGTRAPDAALSVNGSADVFPGFVAGGQNFITSNSHGAAAFGKYFYTVTDQSTYADSLSAYTYQKSGFANNTGSSATNADLTATTTKWIVAMPNEVNVLSSSTINARVSVFNTTTPAAPAYACTFTDNTNLKKPTQIFGSGKYRFVNNGPDQSITTYDASDNITCAWTYVSKVSYSSGFSGTATSTCDMAGTIIACASENSANGRFNIATISVVNPLNVNVLYSDFFSNKLTAGTNLTSLSYDRNQVAVVDPINGISNWQLSDPTANSVSVTFTAKSSVGGTTGYTAPSVIVNKGLFAYVVDGTKVFITKATTPPGSASPDYTIITSSNTQSSGTCVLTSLVINDGQGFGSCATGNWQSTVQSFTAASVSAGDTDFTTLTVNKDAQLYGAVNVGGGLNVSGSTRLQNNVTIGNTAQASTTVQMTGQMQIQGKSDTGVLGCFFIHGTTPTFVTGACTP